MTTTVDSWKYRFDDIMKQAVEWQDRLSVLEVETTKDGFRCRIEIAPPRHSYEQAKEET